jgi:hypothetical protein
MAAVAKKLNGRQHHDEDEESLYSPEADSNDTEDHKEIAPASEAASSSNNAENEDNDDNESVTSEEPVKEAETVPAEQTEAEKEASKIEHERQLSLVRNHIDYGTVLAFLDKFAFHMSMRPPTFNTLETTLIDTRNCKF